jgi:hypothetical protein
MLSLRSILRGPVMYSDGKYDAVQHGYSLRPLRKSFASFAVKIFLLFLNKSQRS